MNKRNLLCGLISFFILNTAEGALFPTYDSIYRSPGSDSGQHLKYYQRPGLVKSKRYVWDGQEDLRNIGKNLPVTSELVTAGKIKTTFSQNDAENYLLKQLKTHGILPVSTSTTKNKLTPFLHLQIFIHPVNDDYAVYLALRLFEPVCMDRCSIKCDETWQVITWEKQALFISSKLGLKESVNKKINHVATIFAEHLEKFVEEQPYEFDPETTEFREFKGSGQDPLNYSREASIIQSGLFERYDHDSVLRGDIDNIRGFSPSDVDVYGVGVRRRPGFRGGYGFGGRVRTPVRDGFGVRDEFGIDRGIAPVYRRGFAIDRYDDDDYYEDDRSGVILNPEFQTDEEINRESLFYPGYSPFRYPYGGGQWGKVPTFREEEESVYDRNLRRGP